MAQRATPNALHSVSVNAYAISRLSDDRDEMTRQARRLGAVSEIHADPDGREWHLTVHWARIDGAAAPVGLDLRAFTGTGARMRPTGGVLTAAVLRSLRIGEIVEATRQHGGWHAPP